MSRAWEEALPTWAQTELRRLRQERHFSNLALADRNAEIRQLKSELRLVRRVMRLKNEALCEGMPPPTLRSGGVGVGFEDH